MPAKLNQLVETDEDDEFTPDNTSSFAQDDLDDTPPGRDSLADEGGDTPYEALQKAQDDEEVEVVDAETKLKKGGKVEDEPDVVSDDEPGETDDFPVDVSTEEMEQYSESVKKRIKQFTSKNKRAERRYQRVINENEQALNIIRAQQNQLKQMQSLIQNGERQYVTAATTAATSALERAKSELKQALGDGDADAIAEAQANLATAATIAAQAKGYQPIAPRVDQDIASLDEGVKQMVAQTHRRGFEPDAATKRWMERNAWFETDQRLRNYAIEFARELEADGVNPIEDAKEYYTEIDAEMRRRFPEKFKRMNGNGNGSTNGHRQSTRPPVAGGRPSSAANGKQKLTITTSQARLAEKLGLTLKQYAEAYAKEYPKG